MKYRSTRGKSPLVTVSQAIDAGLAPDGGLYVPETFPQISKDQLDRFRARDLNLPRERLEVITETLAPFFENDPLARELDKIVEAALNFPIPLRPVKGFDATTHVLELFHGPTAAFKDVGARFLAECQSRLPLPSGQTKRTVLVATSGDTGGAVAAAYHGRPNFEVIILFPKGMVSARQQHQLTCWGGNIRTYSVRGTFDDCQRMAKEAFADGGFAKKLGSTLTSANSINIGRLLPQMTYYACASVEFEKKSGKAASFIIPSGNLGNAVAAMWAKKVGFPIRKILLATNANPALTEYLKTGVRQNHPTIATLANAMDVGNPSNLERAIDLYPVLTEFQNDVTAIAVNDDEIRKTIVQGHGDGNTWCPHTATAAYARNRVSGDAWILVSTAHPAKFETVVEPLIGTTVPMPSSLADLMMKPSQFKEIDAKLDQILK